MEREGTFKTLLSLKDPVVLQRPFSPWKTLYSLKDPSAAMPGTPATRPGCLRADAAVSHGCALLATPKTRSTPWHPLMQAQGWDRSHHEAPLRCSGDRSRALCHWDLYGWKLALCSQSCSCTAPRGTSARLLQAPLGGIPDRAPSLLAEGQSSQHFEGFNQCIINTNQLMIALDLVISAGIYGAAGHFQFKDV